MIGNATRDDRPWVDRLVRQLDAWGWPAFFRAQGPDSLLVMDADILEAYRRHHGAPGCAVATPDEAASATGAATKQAVIFCREGERALVKALRAAHPQVQVMSGTYELAPRSLMGCPKLGKVPALSKAEPTRRMLVVLSTPYSDAEYLGLLVRRNGFGNPREVFDRTLSVWLEEHEDFQPARYFDMARRLYTEDGCLDLHVQTDALVAMARTRPTVWRALDRWIKRTDAALVYVQRRDKLAQAALGAVLDPSPYRSVWLLNKKMQRAFRPAPASEAGLEYWLHRLLVEEAELEDFIHAQEGDLRVMTLEELAERPVQVMKSFSHFIEQRAPKGFAIPDYAEPYQDWAAVWDEAHSYRDTFIRYMGLFIGPAGSYVTASDAMTKEVQPQEHQADV